MAATVNTKEDLKAALPDTSETLHVKGLDSSLEIYRDTYGIPHVKARTTHDAFFGQGYATAQDRLWHMDHDRRVAYGRWAEYAGEAALAQDLLMRRFQVLASVRSDYEAVNPETRAMFDSFAAGVNAFLESNGPLPVEYSLLGAHPEPWRPWDCIAVFKARHMLMGMFESKLWRARLVNALGPGRAAEVQPDYSQGHLLIVPPGASYHGADGDAMARLSEGADAIGWIGSEDAGSNNWAVSGSRTASGKPLLAGDPHRPLDTPNVYYQNHIACPEFDAVGLSFPGFPGFPHFGHNAHVAWCVTHAQADYQDLYLERFKEGPEPLYEFEAEWKKADVRPEVIQVRGGQPVEIEVTVTHHGPVILGGPDSGHGVAFKYTGTAGPNQGFQAIPRMLRAASADEVEESMRDWVDPSNNFVYADIHGNIGYLNRGRLPVRSMANAWLPVPGWTGEHEWRGYVPFEELARSRNPETGYIVTANNKIVGDDYPQYIGAKLHTGAPGPSDHREAQGAGRRHSRRHGRHPHRKGLRAGKDLRAAAVPGDTAGRAVVSGPGQARRVGWVDGQGRRGADHIQRLQVAPQPPAAATRSRSPGRRCPRRDRQGRSPPPAPAGGQVRRHGR